MEQVEQMLGMFINTLPLRLSLKQLSAQQLIAYTQDELAQLLEYEHASLAEAQRCSSIAGSAPLFSAVLNYRHSVPILAAEQDAEADEGTQVLAGHERTNYPFAIAIDDFGDSFGITAQIDRHIDANRVLGYMHAAIAALVSALEADATTPALQLSILPQAEREQLLYRFNDTAVRYPQEKLIHELFEYQVSRTPDAVALSFEDQPLTYRALNEKSNQLAHYLRAQGVRADHLVGLCVERSLEMVIGMLGILKAGGAYVPLDPGLRVRR